MTQAKSLTGYKVLVADSENQALTKARIALFEAGASRVDIAADGEAAWEKFSKETYDLVVMDWELTKVSGITLFHRIRSRGGYGMVPVLVTSRIIEQADFALFHEFPVSAYVQKPLSSKAVGPVLQQIVEEHKWYVSHAPGIDLIVVTAATDPQRAALDLKKYIDRSPKSFGVSILIAKSLIENGYLNAAESLLVKLSTASASSPLVMWQLARIYYMSGRVKDAQRLLLKAEKFSAKNIERLCFLGQVNLSLCDTEAARNCFRRVLAVDQTNDRAAAGMAMVDTFEKHVNLISGQGMSHSLAANCNLMGVSLAQSGQVDEGIQLYKAALAFLGEEADALRVTFNMGLAWMRKRILPEALKWFSKSLEMSGGTFDKARTYLHHVQRLMMGNDPRVETMLSVTEDLEERIGARPAQVPSAVASFGSEFDIDLDRIGAEVGSDLNGFSEVRRALKHTG